MQKEYKCKRCKTTMNWVDDEDLKCPNCGKEAYILYGKIRFVDDEYDYYYVYRNDLNN